MRLVLIVTLVALTVATGTQAEDTPRPATRSGNSVLDGDELRTTNIMDLPKDLFSDFAVAPGSKNYSPQPLVKDIKSEYELLTRKFGLQQHAEKGFLDEQALLRLLARIFFPESETEDAKGATRTAGTEEASGWLPIVMPGGKRMICNVPSLATLDSPSGEPQWVQTSTDQLAPDERIPRHLVKKLHESMAGVCAERNDGWWSYSACWNRHVQQYHLNDPPNFLGKGPLMQIHDGTREGDVFYKIDPVRGPYVSVTYFNGTVCDLTNAARETELRLGCRMLPEDDDGSAHLSTTGTFIAEGDDVDKSIAVDTTIDVSEIEKCKYVVWLSSPKACLRELQKKESMPMATVCRALDFATLGS